MSRHPQPRDGPGRTAGDPLNRSQRSWAAQLEQARDQPNDAASCSSKGAQNLAGEPPYSAQYLHRWHTADGCPVRLDYLMTRTGAVSWGGTRAADLLVGWPLGTSSDHKAYRIYVRDPDDVFGDDGVSEAYDGDATLPDDAVDTADRQGSIALWVLPGDDAFVYLVGEDRAERWPVDRTPPGCA